MGGNRFVARRGPGRATAAGLIAVAALLLGSACSLGASAPPQERTPLAPTEPTATLWVSPDGDDGAAGDARRPLRTIARASQLAEPGTEVRVVDGVYAGSIVTNTSGTEDRRIAYVSDRPGGARIVGAEDTPAAWRNTGDHVDVAGFDITGGSLDGLVVGGSWVRVVENRVHGFSEGNCVSTANRDYDMHDIDVLGNVTWGCGNDQLDHGIYVSHPRGVVANNVSHDNTGYGIHCWHNCNQLTIANNVVHDNEEGGIVVGQGDGPNDGRVAADDFVVTNNLSFDNGGTGIREGGKTGPDNVYENNLLWQNEEDVVELQTGRERGTIVADPRFVQRMRATRDAYVPGPDSPAVDAGTDNGAPATAIDGVPRPQGRAVDIGVYER